MTAQKAVFIEARIEVGTTSTEGFASPWARAEFRSFVGLGDCLGASGSGGGITGGFSAAASWRDGAETVGVGSVRTVLPMSLGFSLPGSVFDRAPVVVSCHSPKPTAR